MSEPINFFLQDNDNLKPRHEVRIESLDAQPTADGRRLKTRIAVTPFRERPSFEVAVYDEAGNEVSGTTVIEAMTFQLELTLHLRGVTEPEGEYTVDVALYYEEPSAPQDRARATVHIPAAAP